MGHAPPRYSHKPPPPPGRPDRLSPTRGYYSPGDPPRTGQYEPGLVGPMAAFVDALGTATIYLGAFLVDSVRWLGAALCRAARWLWARRSRPDPWLSALPEPPDIAGLSAENVRTWVRHAFLALTDPKNVGPDGYSGRDYADALDHLVARRGPIVFGTGRPAEGEYEVTPSGGFRPVGEAEPEKIDTLGRPIIDVKRAKTSAAKYHVRRAHAGWQKPTAPPSEEARARLRGLPPKPSDAAALETQARLGAAEAIMEMVRSDGLALRPDEVRAIVGLPPLPEENERSPLPPPKPSDARRSARPEPDRLRRVR